MKRLLNETSFSRDRPSDATDRPGVWEVSLQTMIREMHVITASLLYTKMSRALAPFCTVLFWKFENLWRKCPERIASVRHAIWHRTKLSVMP